MTDMILVTLGRGADLRIEDGQLYVAKTKPFGTVKLIHLGPATKSRFSELAMSVNRLKVHAIEDGPHI